LIREAMLVRRLPQAAGHQAFAGNGNGQLCVCCGRAIEQEQIEYEIEFVPLEEAPLRMHGECYDDWCNESAALQEGAARGGC
jgi:hypothetical protein